MKKRQRQYVNFTKKMIILYCAAYLGFYLHALTTSQPSPPVQENTPVQCPQPSPVLGVNTDAEIITTMEATAAADQSASLTAPEATPSEILEPEFNQIPDDQLLEAWWSTMEYKNRLDVSITAMEPIECEFEVTTYNGHTATIRHSTPMESETCTFDTTLKGRILHLWAKAISADGKIREFGRK